MKYITFSLVALLSLIGCAEEAYCPGELEFHNYWRHEPTVSVYSNKTPQLEAMTEEAIAQWGWGEYIGSGQCRTADICVGRGGDFSFFEAGSVGISLGTNGLGDNLNTCSIKVYVYEQRVVTHLLGHCYGVDHTYDPSSVMNQSPVTTYITDSNYNTLDCVLGRYQEEEGVTVDRPDTDPEEAENYDEPLLIDRFPGRHTR